MIVIGSTALNMFGKYRNEPKDLDIFLYEGELWESNVKVDSHRIPKDLHGMLLMHSTCFHEIWYLNPDAIYTLKCSHFAWDQHWEKTKRDILLLKHNNCYLIKPLYDELKKYWETVHGNKDFLSLNKPKEYFFNDFVKYKYDHDYLHELVSYPNAPIYTKCLRDGQDVMIDKTKFDKLSFDDQVKMFREEITVIACERWLLQDGNKISWFEAYHKSLKKTIINLTKNWANDFLIFNLEHFVKPDYKYFKHLIETTLEK